jgi:hypothetical protein
MGRMRRFPSPISQIRMIAEWRPGQFYSIDLIKMKKKSCRGYIGYLLMVDKATDKSFSYFLKTEEAEEFLAAFKEHFAIHHNGTNPIVVVCTHLLSDNGSQATSQIFLEHLKNEDISIHLYLSAPYQQVQNRAERFHQTIKGGVKTCMAYNNAPDWYWCYALVYFLITYNSLPKYGCTLSRDEGFTGVKPDMSCAVPFYAKGVYQVSPEERKLLAKGKSFGDKARICTFLGYAKGNRIEYKNSFDCLLGPSTRPQILVRHDCYFRTYQEGPDLLSLNQSQRYANTFQHEERVNYDESFGTLPYYDGTEESDDPLDDDDIHLPQTEVGDDTTENDLPSVYKKIDKPIKIRTTSTEGNTIFEAPYNQTNLPSDPIIKSLEEIELELELPWQDPTQPRCKRKQKVDPRYQEFIERILSKVKKTKSQPNTPPAEQPTVGYNLRKRINNQVYRQTPAAAANLAKLQTEMKNLLPDEINPPPPIFIHITKPPLGETDPATLYDALQGPDREEWWIGYTTEMERLKIRNTWAELTIAEQRDKSIQAIKSKFVCRCTQRADGTWKYRVRLCACGYSQKYGRDYLDTFAPTAKFKSFNVLMQLATINDWDIQGLDIENAFLEADLEEEIYMYIPDDPTIKHSPKRKVKLIRTLYGLKQSGERFFDKMKKALIEDKFEQSPHDPCVFIKLNERNHKRTYVLLYVDDIIITGSDPDGIWTTIEFLEGIVEKLTDLGEISRFIGVDIKRDRENRTMYLTQEPYITKIQETDPVDLGRNDVTPLDSTYDYRVSGDNTKSLEQTVGQLRYVSDHTRPDTLIASSLLGSHAKDPADVHIRGGKRTKRYLRGTKDKGIEIRGTTNLLNLFGMCDGSYIPYADSRSQLGYAIFLNLESGTIQARSHRDTTVSHSSFEIEIKALDELIRALVWVRGFLTDLGYDQSCISTPIYIDNEAAITIGNSYKLTENNSHMVRNLNYINQEVQSGRITLKYIDTDNNVADILTKALPKESFVRHAHTLLTGFGGKPIVPRPTKTEQRLQGVPVTLKGAKRPREE